MEVEYIDHMGDDITVVNAARVSFSKESNFIIDGDPDAEWRFVLPDDDKKLLSYLARHNHWTPFSHPQATFRIKAPIFVARQLFKHKIGMTENEVSRRYVDEEPEFYCPDTWRQRAPNVKQGSSNEPVLGLYQYTTNDGIPVYVDLSQVYKNFLDSAVELYTEMIIGGVAPEQARMVLPQSMYTEWYWTGSLASFARICKQRLDSHAQAETREIAEKISEKMKTLFPYSWEVLVA